MNFHSKIVGSTFCDGQRLFHALKEGDKVRLVREPRNKFDKNAVRVDNWGGSKLGYLPKDTAKMVSDYIAEGREFTARVSDITGRDKANLGCNLYIVGDFDEGDFRDGEQYYEYVENS